MPSDHPAAPALGSLWLARDGRRMRVTGFREPDVFGRISAIVDVLNPAKGQRRKSQQALEGFGSFLQPLEPQDAR